MKFETAAEIKARKEAAGKSSQQEEKRKAKLAEKANRKYELMAAESAKREAARKKAAESKPKLVVDRSHVITAPALLAATPKPTKGPEFEAALKNAIDKANAEAKYTQQVVTGRLSSKNPSLSNKPKAATHPGAKQVWDETSKQWVKRT